MINRTANKRNEEQLTQVNEFLFIIPRSSFTSLTTDTNH
jgi:hypothetical protein